MSDRPSVLLVDDHPAFRAGIRALLEKSGTVEVVGEAADGQAALREARRLMPDVMLLDMDLPLLSGVDVARTVRAEAIPTRVLALSAYDDPTYVRGLLDGGAAGYLTKEKAPELIVEAVVAVARGEGRWFVSPKADAGLHMLTDREREVLNKLAEGLSNMAIAEALCLSEFTVRNHLTNIYAKLGLESSRAAIVWAIRHGVGSR